MAEGAQEELRRLPDVAREAILAHLERRKPDPSVAQAPPLVPSAPVFVTLKIGTRLRGCMGELEAHQADLAAETMDRAVASAFHDPRFPPLELDELADTSIDVTILEPLEPTQSLDDLDPLVYGIEVSDATGRRAVLLPDIEGIDTVEKQVDIARRKAGIPESAALSIQRFRVTKISEE
jgi:AmmeMemoRadiSam system protein A